MSVTYILIDECSTSYVHANHYWIYKYTFQDRFHHIYIGHIFLMTRTLYYVGMQAIIIRLTNIDKGPTHILPFKTQYGRKTPDELIYSAQAAVWLVDGEVQIGVNFEGSLTKSKPCTPERRSAAEPDLQDKSSIAAGWAGFFIHIPMTTQYCVSDINTDNNSL